MLELLIRLEYKRQACRRRALGESTQRGDSYFGVALIVLLLAIVPPTALVPLVPLGSTLGLVVLVIGGLVLVLTIVGAPLGLLLL